MCASNAERIHEKGSVNAMGSSVLVVMIIIWAVVTNVLRKKNGGGKNAAQRNGNPSGGSGSWYTEKLTGLRGSKRPFRASDGHVMKGEQDISCRQFGHDHPEWEEPSTRYIVHDDPEEGYIILWGT